MSNEVAEAQALDRLLQGLTADPRIVFGFYYKVRSVDPHLANKLLQYANEAPGLYARQKRRLKWYDKEVEKWLTHLET